MAVRRHPPGKASRRYRRKGRAVTTHAEPERYGLTWPGKAASSAAISAPAQAVLCTLPSEGVRHQARHLFIEGDNLDALKLLQPSYAEKIRIVYIDPPYNTGNDYLYPDNFRDSSALGGCLHANWLNMMYPRLSLAKKLLSANGVIFVSIGDEELANVLLMLNEIMGEGNRLGIVSRVTKRSSNKGTHFAPSKDHLLVYARDLTQVPPFMEDQGERYRARFNQCDERGAFAVVGLYQAALDARPNQRYWVECPDGSLAIPPGETFPFERYDGAQVAPTTPKDKVWRWSRQSYFERKHLLVFKESSRSPLLTPNGEQSRWNVYTKYYLEDREERGTRPRDFLEDVTNDQGAAALRRLGLEDVFPFAKPVELVRRCLRWVNDSDAICLDFFAGSGTTAQAVLEQNAEDGGQRSFILVQSAEPTGRADYPTIAEIAKERVRRLLASYPNEGARVARIEVAGESSRGMEG